MSDLWKEKISCCCFQYALTDRSTCEECGEYILNKSLRAKCEFGNKYYHFDCFWKHETTAKCKKDDIMIAVQQIYTYQLDNTMVFWNGVFYDYFHRNENARHLKTFWKYPYVSLDVLEQDLDGILPLIRPEDLKRIKDQVALDQEGKTSYYIPTIKCGDLRWSTCSYCFRRNPRTFLPDIGFYLIYDKFFFHPKCLAETGLVNIDAKDMHGYDTLDDTQKKLLDHLFKKNNEAGPIFLADDRLKFEHCASKECKNLILHEWYRLDKLPANESCYRQKSGIEYRDIRIRYEHLSYHPQCFAALGKVNTDGKDIPNYDNIRKRNKMILDSFFIKKDDFDIPIVEKAKKEDYCSAAECSVCRTALKFPYPYTIKKDQLQIRFHGFVYHPICFQASGKSNVATKDMKTYENLTGGEKLLLDGIFKKVEKRKLEADRSNVSSEEVDGPSTKKKKLSDESEEQEDKRDVKCIVKQEVSYLEETEAADKTTAEEGKGAEIVIKKEVIESFHECDDGEMKLDSKMDIIVKQEIEDFEDATVMHAEENMKKEMEPLKEAKDKNGN